MLPIPNKATITAMNSSHCRLSFGDGWSFEFGELDELVIAIAHNAISAAPTQGEDRGNHRHRIAPTKSPAKYLQINILRKS